MFWLSLNFIYLFAVRLGWLPVAGYASFFVDPVAALRYMVLPATSLGFNQSALIARISDYEVYDRIKVPRSNVDAQSELCCPAWAGQIRVGVGRLPSETSQCRRPIRLAKEGQRGVSTSSTPIRGTRARSRLRA